MTVNQTYAIVIESINKNNVDKNTVSEFCLPSICRKVIKTARYGNSYKFLNLIHKCLCEPFLNFILL